MAPKLNSSQPKQPHDFWIISDGHCLQDHKIRSQIASETSLPTIEYTISDFGRYLISPEPIEFEKRLVGCEIHYHQPATDRNRPKIWQILPRHLHRLGKPPPSRTELLLPRSSMRIPRLKDGNLEAHLNKLYAMLRSNDPIYQGLANLDRSRISDIVGICEDLTGNRTWLRLRGSISDKIEYIGTNIFKNVRVVLEQAYSNNGVFELRAFDFPRFDATASHAMLKVYRNGRERICILDEHRQVSFWLAEPGLLDYLHLLRLSIDINPTLRKAFRLFLNGTACPIKLLFKQDLAIDYSRCELPMLYRQAIGEGQMVEQDRDRLLRSLNHRQLGVSVHYLPRWEFNNDRLCTHLSVMHDIRALNLIKETLPALYTRVAKLASITEAGDYYLLDAVTGYQNVD